MSYLGTVRDGKVELPPGVLLPDGTRVRVEPLDGEPDPVYGLADEAVPTGIADLSEQHDHYAHGTPKRGP
ncbi:MAG: hypothetical protein AB1716_11135 [Planctomycetota bacterium]